MDLAHNIRKPGFGLLAFTSTLLKEGGVRQGHWLFMICFLTVVIIPFPASANSKPAKRILVLCNAPLRDTFAPLESLNEATYIVVVSALAVCQTLTIAGLLWQGARRRKITASLDEIESEKRFKAMANTTPFLIWVCDKDGKVRYFNDRWVDFTGRELDAGSGDTWITLVHPDDSKSIRRGNASALKHRGNFSREYRLRRWDGEYRWMRDVAAPRINGDGSFAGFVGSASDITDQKLAHEALEKTGGRLIEAQEKERSRIARELHDDICQRLALLSLELDQARKVFDESHADRDLRMLGIRQHCSEIAGDVQALSHELHSSKLDYLGLAAALRSFCKEFSLQQNVEVHLTQEDVPNPLPRDISLCLFRVAQEALRNAMKHSGTTRFTVDLRGAGDQIQLEIRDTGAGFDVEDAREENGLGLVSMQERVHLVKGTFTIESALNQGTRVGVSVPLAVTIPKYDATNAVVGFAVSV